MEAVVRTHQEDDKVNNQGLVHLLDISSPGSPLLPLTDITKFLNEQCRSLDDAANRLTQSYNCGTEFITAAEAKCVLYCLHNRSIQKLWCYSVDYIEEMLHDQLVAEIGKNAVINLLSISPTTTVKCFLHSMLQNPFAMPLDAPITTLVEF
jgi:hypothetical protein